SGPLLFRAPSAVGVWSVHPVEQRLRLIRLHEIVEKIRPKRGLSPEDFYGDACKFQQRPLSCPFRLPIPTNRDSGAPSFRFKERPNSPVLSIRLGEKDATVLHRSDGLNVDSALLTGTQVLLRDSREVDNGNDVGG